MEFALAEQSDKRTLDTNRVFEPKFDGERAFLVRKAEGTFLINRRKNNITANFPEVALAGDALPIGTVLDGEVTIPSLDGTHNCPSTAWRANSASWKAAGLSKSQPAVFAAFDVLFKSNEDVRLLPFRKRRELLEELAKGGGFTLAPQMSDGWMAWKVWVDFEGSEGVMAKDLEAPYRGRRSSAWMKIKAWKEEDFKVVGFTSQVRDVSTLVLANGYEVNCPRADEGEMAKKGLSEGKGVMATVRYLPPYRFPILAKVEVV